MPFGRRHHRNLTDGDESVGPGQRHVADQEREHEQADGKQSRLARHEPSSLLTREHPDSPRE